MLFKDLLNPSRGKLETIKCNYSFLFWECIDDRIPSPTNTIYDDMKIYNKEEELVSKYRFISFNTAHTYPGHTKYISVN